MLHQHASDLSVLLIHIPDSKVYGANMGPMWGRQNPCGHHVGHMNLAIWDALNLSALTTQGLNAVFSIVATGAAVQILYIYM